MTRYLIPLVAITALCAGLLHADEKAEKLRALHAKFSDKVVVLTWTSTTSAMGQTIESTGATTGLLVGKGGLFVVSNQPLSNNVGGMASMFGRGESTGPEGFKLHTADGKEFAATEALISDAQNLRWYGAQVGETEGVSFPEKAEVPALGEEVVIIGAHDETLNYARFFRTARINCVVEDGKIYGLDGSLGDCLGGVVLTLDGKLLGILGQKKGKEQAAGGGGFGRILGGLNDPSKALGNRVLMTAGVFGDELKKAQETVLKPDFHKGGAKPTPTTEPTQPTDAPLFEGTIASVKYRDQQKDLYVLINVAEGQQAPEENAKVQILGGDGKQLAELVITRRYRANPLDETSRIEQVGGFIPDPEKKLTLEKGMKVVIPAAKPAEPAPKIDGFRGIERFTKMTEETLKDNYGGIKYGFSVSQIPQKDSPCRNAGIKSGDLIYKVGDKEVTAEMTLQDFTKLLSEQTGDVKLSIVRKGGEKVEITVPAQ